MALITMASYSTAENEKLDCLKRTLECLADTVDLNRHRVIVVDNGSISDARGLYGYYQFRNFKYLYNGENLGTAGAVNLAWAQRQPGEHVIKMDDDVVIDSDTWADQLEEAIERDPQIGIIGLKRKDLMESPDRNDAFKSTLRMLPHNPGDPWIVVEDVNHVMGTCQMYNTRLLDKIGYLYQPRLYGFDDSLAAVRCRVAGFKNCFLPHIRIDHIDPGQTPFQDWKHKVSLEDMGAYNQIKHEYETGKRSVYYNPYT
jgi:GT2 family glycosyltransferase